MRFRTAVGLGACLSGPLLVHGGANAQSVIVVEPVSVRSSRAGVLLEAGAGVMNFVNGGYRDLTNPGVSWAARLVLGTRSVLGGEVSYLGTLQDLQGSGDSKLLRNGLEGGLRLGIPIAPGHWFLSPYVYGGVGWNRLQVISGSELRSLSTPNDLLSVPAGLGMLIGHHGVTFDVRSTYRWTFFNDLPVSSAGRAKADLWSVDFLLGYEF